MSAPATTAAEPSLLALLGVRRFAPLFATQFLGALNDNVYKNALVVLITFGLGSGGEPGAAWLITAAAGIFILPFFLFSATAGQLADKLDRAMLMRRVKLLEIAIMALGAAAFVLPSQPALMALLFLMATGWCRCRPTSPSSSVPSPAACWSRWSRTGGRWWLPSS